MSPQSRSPLFHYFLALTCVAVATWMRILLQPYLGERVPFVTYFLAVPIIAWIGGLGPGLFTLFLSGLAASHYFIPPNNSLFPKDAAGWVGLSLFGIVSGAVVLIVELMRRRSDQAQQERERFSITISSIGDAVITTDSKGAVTYLNSVAEELTGWSTIEAQGKALDVVFQIINEQTRQTLENPVAKVLKSDGVVGLANHTLLIAKDGTERPIDDSAAPIRDANGDIQGVVLIFRDVTERRRTELLEAEQRRLLTLRLQINEVLATHHNLREGLQKCTQILVDSLDVTFARIWTLNESTQTLELQASAGLYTHLDGPHSRIKMGEYKIGRIAQNRRPHLTNEVPTDPNVSDQEWAKREKMVAFAGYPLSVGEEVFGVVAMFAQHSLSETILEELALLSDVLSHYVERNLQAKSLVRSEKLHRVLGSLTADYGLVCRLEPDGTLSIDYVTEGFQKVTGYTLEELDSRGGWKAIVNPEDTSKVQASIQHWLKQQDHTSEIEIITKEGESRKIEYFGIAEEDKETHEINLFLAAQDVTEKRAIEEQLNGQREWLRGTLASIGDAVIATDTNGCVSFMNPVAESLTGWTEKDANGVLLTEVFHIINETTRKVVENPVEKVLAEGIIVGLANHTVLISKNGIEWPIDDSAAPIRDENGNIVGVVLVFRDVTEQKAVEREIRESERRYRLIGDAANDAIWDWNLVTNNVHWNEGLRTNFGFSAIEIGSDATWWVDHIHPDDRELTVDSIHAVIDGTKENWSREYRFQRADNSFAYVFDRGRVVRDESGKPIRMVGSMLDLTERKLAEERLKEREVQYRSIFESTSDALLIFNQKGQLIEVNPAACEMHGYSYDELIGMDGRQLIQPKDHVKFADFMQQVKTGKVFHVEGTHVRKDGSHLSVQVTGSSFQYASQSVLLAAVRDVTDQKKAVAALQESEALLRFILESTEIGQWDLDLINDTATRTLRHDQIFGYDELLPEWNYEKFLHQHVHADDREWVDRKFQEAAHGGDDWALECRIRRTDGELRWIWVASSTYLTRDGQPTRMAGLVMDITERKNAETRERELLQEAATANAKFEAFFDQGPLFAGILTLDGTLLEANRHSLEASGYAQEEVIGKHFWECPWWTPSPELQKEVEKACQQAAVGEPYRSEMPYFVADGSQRMVDIIIIPIKDETGRVVFVAPTGTDVTERNLAVNSIIQRSQQLRQLADVASQVNIAIDVTSVLRVVTEEARRLIGAHQAVTSLTKGPNWEQAINTVSLSEKYEKWNKYDSPPDGSGIYTVVCQTNEPMRLTQEQLESHPDWKGFGVEADNHPPIRGWLAVPLMGRGGRNIGLIQLSDKEEGDFTADDEALLAQLAQMASSAIENAQLVENLREADRRKDDFLAMLAHELRNPLAPIRSGLDILAMTSDGPDETITLMQDQMEHVIRLVDDLLDVSRIMRDKVELRLQPIELSVLIKRSVDAIRPIIDSYQHELVVSLPDNPVWLNVDQVRIVQVLENLLTNASKYMDAHGRIELTVERQDEFVSLRVHDSGIGIEPELLPNIFQLFTQSTRSLDRSQGGLGIGLTLVQKLVHMHGGRVSASSEGLGCGSTFAIQLPTIDTPQNVQPITPEVEVTKQHRILIVDDNKSAAVLLARLLGLVGDHEVFSAHDGLEALETIKDKQPEIVFLDIGLPGMNGYEVGRKVREETKWDDVLLVALTGYGQEEDFRKSKQAGFDEHLVKPPSIEQMKSILAHPKLENS